MSIKKTAECKSIRLLRKRNELLSVDVLLKNKSAVGRNNLTGHVRSGKEISECAGDIGNITDEALGNGARKCVELILVNAAEHVCHDHAGCDGVNANSASCELKSKRSSKSDDAGL